MHIFSSLEMKNNFCALTVKFYFDIYKFRYNKKSVDYFIVITSFLFDTTEISGPVSRYNEFCFIITRKLLIIISI